MNNAHLTPFICIHLFMSYVIVASTLMLALRLCYACIVEQISLRFCREVGAMDDLYVN